MKESIRLWTQAALCLSVAVIFSLIVNKIHPNGLDLTRNYFPKLPDHPFTIIALNEAKELSQYQSDEPGGITFLDARKEASYQQGHIPEALICDHYQQSRFIPEIIQRLSEAMVIVIYCNGGECEDSFFLANDLVYEHNIDPDVIHIFKGGMNEWRKAKLPIRLGENP